MDEKLKKASLYNFVPTELRMFHSKMVAELYKNVVISNDRKSFKTDVYSIEMTISISSLAEE